MTDGNENIIIIEWPGDRPTDEQVLKWYADGQNKIVAGGQSQSPSDGKTRRSTYRVEDGEVTLISEEMI